MKLKERNGVTYPAKMRYRSWIVLGPPGSGKSYLIEKIGGFPGEVGIDISMKKWWAVEPMTHRPREIQLAFPFKGFDEGLSVYDERWQGMQSLPEVDFERIKIPRKKKFILAPNWRARFVFDFLLPPPRWLYRRRQERLSSADVRLVDMGLTLESVAWQVHIHWQIAWFFYQSGLQVMLRPFNSARPFSFPLLKKIMQKKGAPFGEAVTPALDWCKVRHVRFWVDEAAPPGWKM